VTKSLEGEAVDPPPNAANAPQFSTNRGRLGPFVFPVLGTLLVTLFILELAIGSIPIPVGDVVRFLLGAELDNEVWETILRDLRVPRAIAALVCGAALGAAGLQLQTLFRNPLAGPWALGLTGGAELGAAVTIAAGTIVGSAFLAQLEFLSGLGIVASAMIGAAAVAAIVASVARRVSTMTLLIVGLMLGYLAEGLVSVVMHFTTEIQGKVFASWSDGSFGGVQWEDFPILLPTLFIGLTTALLMVKPLNALLLGERYAASLGLPVERARLFTLMGAVILAAPVTAYCGPILFIGIIAPHMARGILNTSDHRLLMPATMLLGAAVGLAADLVVHLPWERHVLHLNAVNAVIGAPFVIALLLRNRNMRTMEF